MPASEDSLLATVPRSFKDTFVLYDICFGEFAVLREVDWIASGGDVEQGNMSQGVIGSDRSRPGPPGVGWLKSLFRTDVFCFSDHDCIRRAVRDPLKADTGIVKEHSVVKEQSRQLSPE